MLIQSLQSAEAHFGGPPQLDLPVKQLVRHHTAQKLANRIPFVNPEEGRFREVVMLPLGEGLNQHLKPPQ